MITFDKERNAWNFQEATQDEKDALMQLAEKYWASAMAGAIARQMMLEAIPPEDDRPPVDGESFTEMH